MYNIDRYFHLSCMPLQLTYSCHESLGCFIHKRCPCPTSWIEQCPERAPNLHRRVLHRNVLHQTFMGTSTFITKVKKNKKTGCAPF